MERFAKKASKDNLKFLTVLARNSMLDAWLGLECASAGGYNIAIKIKMFISTWQQAKMAPFYIWNLGQLIVWA